MRNGFQQQEKSTLGAVIIGSGPSLASVDMTCFKGRPSIAFNRAYVAYSRWGFTPPYYACIDRTSLADNIHEIGELAHSQTVERLFLRDSAQDLGLVPNEHVQLLHVTEEPKFSTDLNCLGMFHNVAAVSVQILAALGFQRLLLVGIDGVYRPQPHVKTLDCPSLLEAAHDNDPNHFCADYHGTGRRYTRPTPAKFMHGWRMLASELSAHEIEIMNATPDSAVDCFQMISLDEGLNWLDEGSL